MSAIAVTDEQLAEMTRVAVAREVSEQRPLIRAELVEEMRWVTAETGVAILEIGGKEPLRTFRRLMRKWKVRYVKLVNGEVRYERAALLAGIEKRAVPSGMLISLGRAA